MNYEFNVNTTEQDFLDFNIFMLTRSPFGKKQFTKYRIMIIAIYFLFVLFLLLFLGFSKIFVVETVVLLLLTIIFQVHFVKFFTNILKMHLKSLKKSGKMPYSPTSKLEFGDEYIVETTPDNRLEQKYSSIERVSVVDNKVIYIHTNNSQAFILPMSLFSSNEEINCFLNYIKTQCSIIDIY